MNHKPGSLEESAQQILLGESVELEEGVSSSDKKKIAAAIKKGKKVKVTHKWVPKWKDMELGVSNDNPPIPYIIDGKGSEDIFWKDIKSFKIESTELEEEALTEGTSDVWIGLLLDAIRKNQGKPEFGKAAQALEDWANRYPRTWDNLIKKGNLGQRWWGPLEEALDLRIDRELW